MTARSTDAWSSKPTNICRSPLGEGVFRELVRRAGLDARFEIDSAATTGYQVGRPTDHRAQAVPVFRGYDISQQRARQVVPEDLVRFDVLLAMDRDHVRDLRRLTSREAKGENVRLFDSTEVPDPYYGDERDFERVLDQVESAAAALLDELRKGL